MRPYLRIAAELRAAIESGELQPGDRLPSLSEIRERHGVAQATATRVIDVLKAEGLVIARQGYGTVVRGFREIRRSSPARLAHDRWSHGQSIQDADTEGRERTVGVETGEAPAPEWSAGPLGIKPGTTVAYRNRTVVVDDRPVQLATSYLPTDVARGTAIMHTDAGPGGIYARLAEAGFAPVNFTEYVRGRMPTQSESSRLSLPVGTPVLEITRHARTETGRCVEVNRMILDATAYVADYTFGA